MTSLPASEEHASVLVTGSATYKPAGCKRYTGAPLPPHGTPTPISSLENINERLERLAFGARPEGHNAPPLETYTTTTSEHGEIYRATPDYVRWMRSRYPGYGAGSHSEVSAPSRPTEGKGPVTF